MEVLIQGIVSGLLLGGVFALFSIGLTFIFGVMDVINFAHGEYLMLAMYGTFFLWKFLGLDPYLSILLLAPLFFFFGLISQRAFIRPIIDKPVFIQIVVTLGLSIVLQNLALFFFSADMRSLKTWYKDTSFQFAFISFNYARVIAFAISLLVTLLLFLYLNKTKSGLAIKSTAQNREAAQLVGIDIQKVDLVTFGIGIAMCGIAGGCLAAIFPIFPTVGQQFVLIAFVVTVLGGLGNIYGAFFAGLLIGIVYSLAGIYLEPVLSPAIYYAIFILVLVLRATGKLELLSEKISLVRKKA